MDDPSLLELYARDGSADAFARLVGRYVDLVYSAAARQVGRGGLAEDVTQAVFIALARRARSGAFKDRSIVLSAWLLTAARYAAIDVLKRESRRRKHERGAAAMRSEIIEVAAGSQSGGESSSWEEVRPVLDAAMLGLSEKDRRAVALRYFEGLSFEEVGAALGATREAAKQRVFRAIERLRDRLLGRGVTVSAGALGALIGANAVHAAPPALAGACGAAAASAALAAGGASAGAGAGAAAAPKIANAALAAMTCAKAKLAASAIAATLLVAGSGAAITTVTLRARAQAQAAGSAVAQAPVVPVVAQPVQPDARPADDWYPPFLEAYAPKAGAAVRLVPPPFIDQRWNFWKSQQPRIPPLKPGEKMWEKSFIIEFDGSEFRWKMVSVVDGDIDTALRRVAGLRAWEIIGPETITKAPLPGDWVYLAKARQLDKIANIAAIASEKLKSRISIRPVTRKLDVVIARGQLQLKGPVDESGGHIVDVGLGEKVKPAPGAPNALVPPRSASIRQVFDEAEDLLRVQIIDESDWGRSRVMLQRYVGREKSKPEEHQRLITRLMEQTGLELQVEQREIEAWEVAEEEPG